MELQLVALLLLIVGSIFLSLMLGYLYYLYMKDTYMTKWQGEIFINRTKVIEEAQNTALEIVRGAQEKSREMLSQFEELKIDHGKALNEHLATLYQTALNEFAKSIESFESSYKATFEEQKAEYEKKVNQSLKDLQDISGKELEEYSKSLKKDSLNSQVYIGAKIQEEVDKANVEIEDYKARKFKAIDVSISKVVEKVTTAVLGRSLTSQDHEQLVLQSFEEAKKDKSLFEADTEPKMN